MDQHAGNQPETTLVPGNLDITQDAVVIVPGIMGSELRDASTGRTVWGLSGVRWLIDAWTRPKGLKALHMTDAELDGAAGRLEPVQLLRHSAWTPYLKGFEPYTDLISAVHACVAHPAAVLEFPYDWRFPVTTNGRLLAAAARRHLSTWREHPAHTDAIRARVDQRPARLVFVAHSMGGLVAQAALDPFHDGDLPADTRAVITLGTPFHGAVKAAAILNTGHGAPAPLPHQRLKSLCTNLPGLHDLLPQYLCMLDGADARHLTPADIEHLGGNRELARLAADSAAKRAAISLPGHRAVVGTNQTTAQSMTLRDGVLHTHCHTVRRNSDHTLVREPDGTLKLFDVQGDGTVHKESAALGTAVTHLPLHHGAVASDPFALRAVQEVLREDTHLGPPMGGPGCGLDIPDLARPGHPWELSLTGLHSPAGITCRITTADPTRPAPPLAPRLHSAGHRLAATITLPAPGLYRVTVTTRDRRHISQMILAADHP
ncbi:esterase/lipase family protein [Streptomyces sp. bgisy034]|uniref:esterase/lipase family protein n=1 Tax=Streptomyces sp. bgisy034 TaxID=3413774 RepID=UPI003EBAFAA6